ncbi:helix-turn-helix transcriptional regulator [Microbacterium insulae]|uniref:Helix-turn-helix transcriptional regulator n=1 Tax=Microbacterium insulae TaxID=483014 RepID=A0ABW3AEY4_9MICO
MDKILFIEEVADLLRRTPAQLRWMVHCGTAPQSAMIAGRRCWRQSDVEKFIDEAFSSTPN